MQRCHISPIKLTFIKLPVLSACAQYFVWWITTTAYSSLDRTCRHKVASGLKNRTKEMEENVLMKSPIYFTVLNAPTLCISFLSSQSFASLYTLKTDLFQDKT